MTRRAALRSTGGAGVAGGLVGMAGLRATTQRATPPVATPFPEEVARCVVAFEAAIRQGPSAGMVYQGILRLPLEADSAIDHGTLIVGVGEDDDAPQLSEVPVVGQASGRAVNLLITVGDGQYVYGIGTFEHPVGRCQGRMGGPLVGPLPGDAGDWVGYATCSDCIQDAYRRYNIGRIPTGAFPAASSWPAGRPGRACISGRLPRRNRGRAASGT
ncbi:MAG: hypothetical protein QOF01_2030 [Thermomicrobiales bacterium]|nr:hypothetical protein [Thermomicrobiales bacterium]